MSNEGNNQEWRFFGPDIVFYKLFSNSLNFSRFLKISKYTLNPVWNIAQHKLTDFLFIKIIKSANRKSKKDKQSTLIVLDSSMCQKTSIIINSLLQVKF